MYYYGRGVPQDYGEALKWYRKAAEQGHVNAQYKIDSSGSDFFPVLLVFC